MTDHQEPLIAVIGAGTMGRGIASAYLAAGARVVLVEADAERARLGRDGVSGTLAKAIDRGHLQADLSALTSRLSADTSPDATGEADLVIEAVPEEIGIKTAILSATEAAIRPTAILASNTSSISVTRLARALRRPESFLGLHFFNPVLPSMLVEIVRGQSTRPEAVEGAIGFVKSIGKEPLVVSDSPGFASSRLGVLLGLEAARMLEEGVASAEDIDKAMTLGYKHPMGPLRLSDLVGLDVRLGIARYLSQELSERFTPPKLLETLVAEGRLGRKTGQGFFTYD